MNAFIRFSLVGLSLIFFPLALLSQQKNMRSYEIVSSQGIFESAFMIRPEGRYTQAKGSPYLSDEWSEGKVWLDEDTVPGIFRMRYNVFGNEMQFLYQADTFAIANPLAIDRIELDGKVFNYLAFMYNENYNMAYFEVLQEGKYRLLSRHEVRLVAGREPMTPYHPQNEYDRFVHRSGLYLQTPESPIPHVIPSKKKQWFDLFKENRVEIENFWKNEHIRLNREDDVLRLVKFLNQNAGA